jgi:hypothetical protein
MTLPFQIKKHKRTTSCWFIVFGIAILGALSSWGVSTPESPAGTHNTSAQRKTSDMLFVENKIWNVELEFEKEQYAAMQPKKGMEFDMGVAPDDFGLGNILAPATFKEGDSNHNGRL